MGLSLDTLDIHHPDDYAAHGFPWAAWDLLRREAPVFYYERDDIEPFWAVTRYDDVMTVSNHPDVFINGGPRLRLALKGQPEIARAGLDRFGAARGWDPDEPPDLVFMDNPRHRRMRRLASWAFTQGAMRRMQQHFQALAEDFTRDFMADLKAAAARGESRDLVQGLAAKLPLAAIGEILGLPPGDWQRVLVWSNALLGEFAPGYRHPGESRGAAGYRSMDEFRGYLEALVQESRAAGAARGGFIDHLVHTPVHGALLSDQQLIGYLFLLVAAGNDTTRNAFSGGVAALLEHPEQLARLQAEPALLPDAVEEILRWTSPVGSFLRTVTRDFVLNGVTLREADTVGVFYPSANRDERVFANPYRFDITRRPNPHLTFGFGAHFCLGTNLARAELAASLAALLPHLHRLERAGPGERMAQTHVLGYSHLPMRLRAG
ncbi:MAG: cytochrome P450 [Gammaproteobacteria bacterium]|nr:cytochrome P450 [Gammaproteobacteria bacterium]